MAVTQKDIAQRLNISQAHVARALSGRSKVSAEMRSRVESVAREMGYEAGGNREARALVARRYGQRVKTGVVAVVFPVEDVPLPRQMPFFMPLLEGMETEAVALGLDLCMCLMRPGELPRMIRDRNVDGVILVGSSNPEVYARHAVDLPTALFHAQSEWAHCVTPDDYEGARLATRHLLGLGHRRIAYQGISSGGLSLLRIEGYRAALAEFGVPVREEWIETSLAMPPATVREYCAGCGVCAACAGWGVLKARSGVSTGAKVPFTAVVCHNDTIAMGIVDRAREDGLRVPQDLSVTGFDDITPQYHFEPAITSVDSDNFEIGRCTLRLLHEDIEQGETHHQEKVFPVRLIERQSTAPPRH